METTSKEQMSDYLERLQFYQRLSQGSIHTMEINSGTLYGTDLTLRVTLYLYKWNEDKTNTVYTKENEYFDISEWHNEKFNNETMRQLKERLINLEMIEL